MADSKVVNPARQNGTNLRDQHFGRGRTSAPMVSQIALMAFRAFFFGVIRMKYPSLRLLRTRRRSNPKTPKASPFSRFTTLVFSTIIALPSVRALTDYPQRRDIEQTPNRSGEH